MFAQERHTAIKQLVREHRRLSFTELQERVQVSPATLRRDLTELEQSGEVIRVHGGVLDPSYVRSEISFDERLLRNSRAKKTIAARTASLIPSGSSIFIDAGSTCLEAAKTLLRRKDVRVISHSVAVIAESLHGEAEVICIGGELRKVSSALIGGSALAALEKIHVDFALVGASGLTDTDCSTTELFEAEMKQAILARASRKILLADSTKWLRPSTVSFATWSNFSDWVTDAPPPAKETRHLRADGLKIHSAE